MNSITLSKEMTIEDTVSQLIHHNIVAGRGQLMLADFTRPQQLNSLVLGVGYYDGLVYDITLTFGIEQKHFDFLVTEKGQLPRMVTSKYVLHNSSPVEKDMGSNHIKDYISEDFPDGIPITLNEVGFTAPNIEREVLFSEKRNKDLVRMAKLRRSSAHFREDALLYYHASYSNEPSLVRFRKTGVSPWIVLNTPVAYIASIGAAGTIGLVYAIYSIIEIIK